MALPCRPLVFYNSLLVIASLFILYRYSLLQTSVHDGYLAHSSNSFTDPSSSTTHLLHAHRPLSDMTTKRSISNQQSGNVRNGKMSTVVAQINGARASSSSSSKNTVTTTSSSSDSYPHPEEASSSSSISEESSSVAASSVALAPKSGKKVTHIHTHNHEHDTHTEAAHNHVHDEKEYSQMSQCKKLKEQYGIKPGEDWGRAPSDIQVH
jgi:hypothetical protein